MIAIAIAMTAIAVTVFRTAPPDRYTFKVAAGQVQRFDRLTGEVMICEKGECFEINSKGIYREVSSNPDPIASPEISAQPNAVSTTAKAPTLDQAYEIWLAQKARDETMTNLLGPPVENLLQTDD